MGSYDTITRVLFISWGKMLYRKIFKKLPGLIVIALFAVLLAGCGQSDKSVEQSEEPAYAEAITESIMQAYNDCDYDTYSEHFDPAMKKAMNETVFYGTRDFIRARVGDYQSKKFVESRVAEEIYTMVIYQAKFSEEDAVKVTITFLETDDYVYVSGLYFDSPKLRGQ